MRYSLQNRIEEAELTLTDCSPAFGSVDDLSVRNTRQAFGINQDGAAISQMSFDLGATHSIDLVAIVGLTGAVNAPGFSIDVELNLASVLQASATLDLSSPLQQNYATAIFNAVDADEVVVKFDISTTLGIGYLYAGSLSESLRLAALDYGVNSADPRNRTRAGTSLTTTTYVFTDVAITVVEESFSTLRARAVQWAEEGFATPRLWHFDSNCETCILTGETLFAILDSNRVQLDPAYITGAEARAATTIGLEEVF